MRDLRTVRVREIMTSPVVTIPAAAPLKDAAGLLAERQISCLVVEDGGAPAGMLTERNVAQALSRGAGPGERVDAWMGKPLVCVAPGALVEEALAVMEDSAIRHLPVVDAGKAVGLVTQTNIVRFSEGMLKGYSQALEEQVSRQTVELREAAKFKDEILGMAAHDLRSPLTVILYWCDVLEAAGAGRDFSGLEPADALRHIARQARHMNGLISDLLDIARIHQGKLVLRIKQARIDSVISSKLDVHALLARHKGIAVEKEFDQALPPVEMDQERIGEVLDNLLSNAVKFSAPGDSIRVSASSLPDGGVRVEVADTGQGIDEEDMPKLFVEFAKLGAKPTANEASTGLGLAIVKKIVERHGGRVYAESRKGKGSKFGFTLPKSPKAGAAPAKTP